MVYAFTLGNQKFLSRELTTNTRPRRGIGGRLIGGLPQASTKKEKQCKNFLEFFFSREGE